MEVIQIQNLANTAASEVLGRTDVIAEDLTNLVDIGTEIFRADAVDRYVKSLVNQIGKIVFVNRPYVGSVPSVLMDGWEFGSVLEKIQAELPVASTNESWELVDGASYDPNIFYKPIVTAKFFNSKVTFEVDISITEKQVKQSFQNAVQLNAFLSMLYANVEKAMTIRIDALVLRTINNMTASTIDDGNSARAVNLLTLYKEQFPNSDLTSGRVLGDPEFIRFAAYTMANYMDRMEKISTLFNIGGKARFTPKELLHVVMLSDFRNAADIYLQSDTFHDSYTKLPNAETVPYWQGSGTSYAFGDISKIHVNATGADGSSAEVVQNGILCVMFDRDALGVLNPERRVTSNYNAKAEFWNNFYKWDSSYFNDFNENFVVFYVAD